MKKKGYTTTRTPAILRVLSILCTCLALIDAKIPLPGRSRSLVMLLDVSDSVMVEDREVGRRAAIALASQLAPRDNVGVITFAGKPSILTQPTSPKEAIRAISSSPLEAPNSSASDIALGLHTAVELLTSTRGKRTIVIFTDGRSTKGLPIKATSIAKAGIPILVYPVGQASGGLISRGLALPSMARPGETALARWRLSSEHGGNVMFTVKVDGETSFSGTARLPPGETSLELPVPAGEPGSRIVEIEARDSAGRTIGSASAGGLLQVSGKARVLVVTGDGSTSPVSKALEGQGISAVASGTEGLPDTASGYSGYSAVVLDNVSALYITESQQAELQSYVSGGGGLAIVGGDSSLGRGEYYTTPIEDMLPVTTDTRRRLFFTRAKILFVIDHSGSMTDMVNGTSKQRAAMQGVAESIPELNAQDEVGILTFDTTPSWVLPFTPAAASKTILDSLGTMPSGGGTDMASAIEEVITAFGEAGPTKRHVILLTDGLTSDTGFERLSARLKSIGVSVTTIGIGDDVNEDLLKNLAAWNDGTFYRVEMDKIPKVIRKETVRVTRDLIQEGKFAVSASGADRFTQGLESGLPAILGYLVTQPKSLATVHLRVSPDGSKEKEDPLLASWRYGAGKVAVFTSDSGRAWLSPWSGMEAFNRLWGQTIRSIERSSPDSGLQASTRIEGSGVRLIVEALSQDRRLMSGLRLVAIEANSTAATGTGGAAFPLKETAPGRYEGYAPLDGGGLRQFTVSDLQGRAWTQAWVWNPSGAEAAGLGPDTAAMDTMVSASGGALIDPDHATIPPARWHWTWKPLREALLIAALVLFLLELYGRSIMLGQLHMAKATFQAWWDRQQEFLESIQARPVKQVADFVPDDSAKVMDAYRRLAERAHERSLKNADRFGQGGHDET